MNVNGSLPSGVGGERWIAPDAAPAVLAFREAGAISFQHRSPEESREAYRTSCRVNGLAPVEVARVVDERAGGPGGPPVRIYDPRPGSTEPVAAILFLHGGGWVIGDLDTHDPVCRTLAVRTGAVVVAVDYRLAPEHPFPAALDDARAALAWLRSSAVELGVDPDRIVLVGDSAGGQLAAVLANESADSGLAVCAQVLLYPVTDLRMTSASHSRVTDGFPLTHAGMRWFAERYLPPGTPVDDPRLSPLLYDFRSPAPPTYLCTLDNDPLADEGAAYAARLAAAGTDLEYNHLAGYHHGLVTSAGIIPRGARLVADVCRFVRDRVATVR